MTVLYTASFYQPVNWVGKRFRVSRHHPRGRRVDWETLPFLYPDLQLLRSFRAGDMRFDAFTRDYRSHLDDGYAIEGRLRQWMEEDFLTLGDVTFLCFEREGDLCHRHPLAHWLKERVPSLMLGELR